MKRTFKLQSKLNQAQLDIISDMQKAKDAKITINGLKIATSFTPSGVIKVEDVNHLTAMNFLAITSEPTDKNVVYVLSDVAKYLNLVSKQYELPALPKIPASKKADIDEVIDILENGIDVGGEMFEVNGVIVNEFEAYNFADDEEGTQVQFDTDAVDWMIQHKMLITADGLTYDLPEKLFF